MITARFSGLRLAFRLNLRFVLATAVLLSLPLISRGQQPSKRESLQVYFVDVEGGQATLCVTPAGQSLLIDTGWPDYGGRDADRIAAVAMQAGLRQIDLLLITHYHVDHAGGVPQLAAKIPIVMLVDHGDNREPRDADTEQVWQAYQKFVATGVAKRMIAKLGDVLPLQGIHAEVVSADGATIQHPLPGAGQENPACATQETRAADKTENARSLGTMITFGKLRILDLGDLTWDKEAELVCPANKLGQVDIFVVSHHGFLQSNSPALLNGVAPRVAIMDNGATKGGSPSAWDIVAKSPRLIDLWQLHFSDEGGATHNAPEPLIANLDGPDAGHYLKLTAWADGSFEVFNSRTQKTKSYSH